MTEQQKEKILALKSEGFTNKAIGEQLGLNPEAVKTFIRRHKKKKTLEVKPEEIKPTGPLCKECGKPFQPGHLPNHQFCTDACRRKWWNRHRSGNKTNTCAHCGKEFKAYGNRKYCSHDCYIKERFNG